MKISDENINMHSGRASNQYLDFRPFRNAFPTFYGSRHLIMSIFYSTLLGLGNVLGSEEYWPVLVSLTAIPAVLQFILLLFLPESPRLVNFFKMK